MKKFFQSTIMLLAVLAIAMTTHAADGATTQGDVNGDNTIDISDVTCLTDYLLGSEPENFNSFNADTNHDGEVSIADVTDLIDYLLGGVWPSNNTQPETEVFTVNGVSFTMVTVEGGTFTMGATPDQGDENYVMDYSDNWEAPTPHEVTLSTFSIGQTEVSQDLWRAVMGVHPSWFRVNNNLPVESMSWAKCHEFIIKLNELTGRQFRLPTEAEWEFAARGGNLSQHYKYSGSNDIDTVGWYWGNAPTHDSSHIFYYGTQSMGSKLPNELGLYDMSGNVWEWCLDYKSNFGSEAVTDPVGPATGNGRAYRGGSWNCHAKNCRVSTAGSGFSASEEIGLRLVLDEDNSPKFRCAESVVTVITGEDRSVNLLNGGGSYTVEGGDENLTATASGNMLTVTGTHAGTTTVHVTDNATGATAVVTVIVKPVEKYTVNGVTFSMVAVEGGAFSLGRNTEAGWHIFDWEAADFYSVHMYDFSIGKTEVTQELWQAVMGTNPSYFKGDLQRPVEQVSWEDCQEFIIKLNELTGLNFRLPTEAEWEYAACGGCLRQPTQYAGGNEIDPLAWYSGNVPTQGTQPVGTKAPNELGIHDMNGNVWEWCKDWSDGFDHYVPFSSYGMPSGTHRLRRGGCWSSSEANCGVMTYGSSLPSEKNNRLGLRLVLGGKENCPEVSFDIEEELMLSLGESKSVGIQYGCGRYGVSTSDGITCTISGEKVIVTGTSTGSTSFLLVDEYTGKKIKLDVYVIGNQTYQVNDVVFTMVGISGGKMTMGELNGEVYYTNSWGDPHKVGLDPYYIGQTEVTQELWQAVMGNNPSYFSAANGYDEDLQRPVEQVSWEDCQAFIDKLSELTGQQFRLLTEYEWEYAARGGCGGMGFAYAGSNNLSHVAWYWDNIPSQTEGTAGYGTQPVATKKSNEFGLYDMSGNVKEWVKDWYYEYYTWGYAYQPEDPDNAFRVVRGGSWNSSPQNCQAIYRDYGSPDVHNHSTGLRIARSY